MNKHVVNRETAKKLQDVMKGVENYFIWREYISDEGYAHSIRKISEPILLHKNNDYDKDIAYQDTNTYTLTELLERLPAVIIKEKERWWLHIDKVGAHYLNDKFQALKGYLTDHKTDITNTAARLLLWVASEGHLPQGDDDEINN